MEERDAVCKVLLLLLRSSQAGHWRKCVLVLAPVDWEHQAFCSKTRYGEKPSSSTLVPPRCSCRCAKTRPLRTSVPSTLARLMISQVSWAMPCCCQSAAHGISALCITSTRLLGRGYRGLCLRVCSSGGEKGREEPSVLVSHSCFLQDPDSLTRCPHGQPDAPGSATNICVAVGLPARNQAQPHHRRISLQQSRPSTSLRSVITDKYKGIKYSILTSVASSFRLCPCNLSPSAHNSHEPTHIQDAVSHNCSCRC